MFIIDKKNFKVVKDKNIIGSNYKSKIDKINENDILTFYLKNPQCTISGIGKVASKYQDNTKIFEFGLYSYRLKIKSLNIFEKPINFRDLLDKLSFIKNKSKWQLHLFGSRGLRELSKNDFDIINNYNTTK